jgi:hypothetical protein
MKTFMVLMAWDEEGPLTNDDAENRNIMFVEAENKEDAAKQWWTEYDDENDLDGCASQEEIEESCPTRLWIIEHPGEDSLVDLRPRIEGYLEQMKVEDEERLKRYEQNEWEMVKARYEELRPKFETTANK